MLFRRVSQKGAVAPVRSNHYSFHQQQSLLTLAAGAGAKAEAEAIREREAAAVIFMVDYLGGKLCFYSRRIG
jgi:hypothetical protein